MRFLYIILFVLVSFSIQAQQPASRTDLEKRRASIMESIKETQEQLELTKQNKNATLSQLRALQSKLAERQKLIGNINAEINELNKDIQMSASEINDLKKNLSVQKIRYAQSVRFAYKNRSSYNMVAFLFSSNSYNEAIRRLKYLKKYRDNRKEQAEQIRTTQSRIEKKLGELNIEKSHKDVLKSAEEQQRQVILKETKEKDHVVKELKTREKDLAKEIEKNRKAASQVDQAIQRVIIREIELARKKAEEEERKRKEEEQRKAATASNTAFWGSNPNAKPNEAPANNNTKSSTSIKSNNDETPSISSIAKAHKVNTTYVSNLTPEASAMSNNFENNRGHLPWPVEKGYISLGFGPYKHPIEEKVTLENYGIDITTNPGSTIRCVFEGVVTKVFFIPGRNWNVMVNHGAFFTVYSGLANVSVKADQKISTKGSLGTAGPNDEGNTILNFQIWKIGRNNQFNKLDPAQWIVR